MRLSEVFISASTFYRSIGCSCHQIFLDTALFVKNKFSGNRDNNSTKMFKIDGIFLELYILILYQSLLKTLYV